ncbi:PREDICTED: protein trapped in endoderm-1-like [Priapulus caudatus]|uniref:Protein trapped in endoderm-1-like n=1 Tax=Priapulus caudatus TaxID=37621 RepID=A0ABM1EBI4_PRICU|nr:PREDICTED: protein trapped in endoderm-1-like [Priapulus caudatus]
MLRAAPPLRDYAIHTAIFAQTRATMATRDPWPSATNDSDILSDVGSSSVYITTTSNASDIDQASLPHTSSAAMSYLMCAFGILYSVVGGVGNGATVVALVRDRAARRNAMTKLVIFLAISDLQFCVFALPMNTTRYVHRSWLLGDVACSLVPFVFYTNIATSFLLVTLISVNRYVVIVHQTIYRRIYTKCKLASMIAFAYALPAILLLPTLVGEWGKFGYKRETFSCTFLEVDGRSSQLTLFVVGLCVPTLITVVCYVRILWTVRSRNKSMHEQMQGRSTRRLHVRILRKDERHLTKTVVVVIAAFLVCNAPVVVVSQTVPDGRLPLLHSLVAILTWTNFVANPFIYAIKNRTYRNAYVALLCCSRARDILRVGSDRLYSDVTRQPSMKKCQVATPKMARHEATPTSRKPSQTLTLTSSLRQCEIGENKGKTTTATTTMTTSSTATMTTVAITTTTTITNEDDVGDIGDVECVGIDGDDENSDDGCGENDDDCCDNCGDDDGE